MELDENIKKHAKNYKNNNPQNTPMGCSLEQPNNKYTGGVLFGGGFFKNVPSKKERLKYQPNWKRFPKHGRKKLIQLFGAREISNPPPTIRINFFGEISEKLRINCGKM